MQFAANYSQAAARLLRAGSITLDMYKCPAWPLLASEILKVSPAYIHFPVKVGSGKGPIDAETGKAPDWARFEKLMAKSGTPLMNVHLGFDPAEHPGIPLGSDNPADVDLLLEKAASDIAQVAAIFGAENIIVENENEDRGRRLHIGMMPAFFQRVLDETGTGFLLDLSHARRSALYLDVKAKDYISTMPVHRLREMHVSGVHYINGAVLAHLRDAGLPEPLVEAWEGWWMDHLSMTGEDWDLFKWAMVNIHGGQWAEPWVVSYEYGGIGQPFEAMTDRDVIAGQIPLFYKLVHPNIEAISAD